MNKISEIEFLVSSNKIAPADIPEFWLGIKITNISQEWIPIDISKTALYVNSQRSISWDLAVQNGTIVNLKIAPLRSEVFQWPLGEALFETSGTYELQLVWESFSARQQVVVQNS